MALSDDVKLVSNTGDVVTYNVNVPNALVFAKRMTQHMSQVRGVLGNGYVMRDSAPSVSPTGAMSMTIEWVKVK